MDERNQYDTRDCSERGQIMIEIQESLYSLARNSGVSPNATWRAFTGRGGMQVSSLEKLARYLGVSMDDLAAFLNEQQREWQQKQTEVGNDTD